MCKALWIIGSFILALAAGPVAFVSAKAGVLDPADIYIVLGGATGWEVSSDLKLRGVREIGLSTARFGRLVTAKPEAHTFLSDSGYLVLPASTLAGICGAEAPNGPNP